MYKPNGFNDIIYVFIITKKSFSKFAKEKKKKTDGFWLYID